MHWKYLSKTNNSRILNYRTNDKRHYSELLIERVDFANVMRRSFAKICNASLNSNHYKQSTNQPNQPITPNQIRREKITIKSILLVAEEPTPATHFFKQNTQSFVKFVDICETMRNLLTRDNNNNGNDVANAVPKPASPLNTIKQSEIQRWIFSFSNKWNLRAPPTINGLLP